MAAPRTASVGLTGYKRERESSHMPGQTRDGGRCAEAGLRPFRSCTERTCAGLRVTTGSSRHVPGCAPLCGPPERLLSCRPCKARWGCLLGPWTREAPRHHRGSARHACQKWRHVCTWSRVHVPAGTWSRGGVPAVPTRLQQGPLPQGSAPTPRLLHPGTITSLTKGQRKGFCPGLRRGQGAGFLWAVLPAPGRASPVIRASQPVSAGATPAQPTTRPTRAGWLLSPTSWVPGWTTGTPPQVGIRVPRLFVGGPGSPLLAFFLAQLAGKPHKRSR